MEGSRSRNELVFSIASSTGVPLLQAISSSRVRLLTFRTQVGRIPGRLDSPRANLDCPARTAAARPAGHTDLGLPI